MGDGTIWSRLDECVRALDEPFSRAEILSWFRRHYPDTNEGSLAPHIQGATANVLNRMQFASRPPLMVRLGRGSYRRVQPTDLPATVLKREEARPLAAPEGLEWHTEARVQSMVVSALAAKGWAIRSVADTAARQHGIDVVAEREARLLGVEVKGYPSRYYADPRRAGESKPTRPATQARVWFASAVVAAMKLRTKRPEMTSVIALPDFPTYRVQAQEVATSLDACRIAIWWISEDGQLTGPDVSP